MTPENMTPENIKPENTPTPQQSSTLARLWQSLWVRALLAAFATAVLATILALVYVVQRAQPILRQRVIDTLSARFHSPVELDHLDISLVRGVEVRGGGLRILYLAGPNQPDAEPYRATPMVTVRSFRFHTTIRDLIQPTSRVVIVTVDGLDLHIPPASPSSPSPDSPAPPQAKQPRVSLLVNRILVHDMHLFVESPRPGKDPLRFDVPNADFQDVGLEKPLLYTADVLIPMPTGHVHATGTLGPWRGDLPRATPITGDYRFDNVNLASIHGLRGTLASTGHFTGQLGNIAVDAVTDSPDFILDISAHPVPLHVTFRAIVDATSGDTTLAPANILLGHTTILATGTIARIRGQGHDIALTLDIPHGRVEDLLPLGLKGPPLMTAALTLHAHLHIPPGPRRVAAKVNLTGTLTENGTLFTSPQVQDRLDSLSLRAQGKPGEARAAGQDQVAQVSSRLQATFTLADEVMTFPTVNYALPGATLNLAGAYSLPVGQFKFMGHVSTYAKASQMVTGWRSWLLKPIDPLFKKGTAGVELPIELTGSRSDFHFGLAMHGTDESPTAMAHDLATTPK